ncbi:unnamed protein product [Acanthoscelides obtectus]|uniref:Uncharacterized protein n=1 Tax=Acanthoscelides obtectus TaxID=200917 RepID=A0A9P0PXC4_ACAOB|nr:unnamed protein product [Acanthoscelides obtectus]CAK1636544.1 hypothetical protein AOBTE_LOCUS9880 [Acanthoscelides obtectus]
MRSLYNKTYTILRSAVTRANLQKRFSGRSVTGERTRILNETTLTGRLLYYLNDKKNEQGDQENMNATNLLGKMKKQAFVDLGQYDIKQINCIFNMLRDRHFLNNKFQTLKLLQNLDHEYMHRLNEMDPEQIFDVLNSYMAAIPNRIIQYIFYKESMNKLLGIKETLNKEQIIKLIFFIGLNKKHVKVHDILRSLLNLLGEKDIQTLSVEDICIICQATFKTGTKVYNKVFLDKIVQYLNDNLFLLKDPALFIALIKTVRQNRCQTEDLLATISCTMFFNKTLQYYSFAALSHILAVYSDYLYYDENLLDAITEKSIRILKEYHFTSTHKYFLENPRIKDIKTLLWSLSNLNYKGLQADDIKDVIIPIIMKRYAAGECRDDNMSLLEIISHLWMLNYHAYELIDIVLTKENVQKIRATSLQNKHKLNQLLSCIFFEDRPLFQKLNIHPQCEDYEQKFQMEKRPLLTKVMKNLESASCSNEITKFELGCQIPGLNILGITGYKKNIYKAVNIEVLDEYTVLKNTEDKPTGPMQLKLRLLNGAEEGLIVIPAKDVEDYTDEELREYLGDEIDLVC